MKCCVAFVILVSMVGIGTCKNTYMVTVPQSIRAGEEFSVCFVPLARHLGQTNIQFTLLDRKNKTITHTEEDRVFAKDPIVFKIKVPLNVTDSYGYQLDVKAVGGIAFEKRVINIRMSSKISSIFVQTDKAAYKPGDLVQFRVLGTNSKLKLLKDPMNIIITDPKNNRVDQYIDVKPSYGVFTGSFQLSTLTNLGSWNIKVEQKKTKYTKSFTVEKFVLPKFEMNIVFPPFQMRSDNFFRFDLVAKYTFGKPVEGKVILNITRRWGRNNNDVITKHFKMNGKASIRVLMTEITRFGSYINVKAKLVERLTGKSATDSQSTRIFYRREKLTTSSSMSDYFKPGLDYTIIIRASRQDDAPLENPLGTMNITVWYSVLKPIKKDFNTQEMRIYPGSTEEKILWSKDIQISDAGIAVATAKFPIAAVRARITAEYRKAYAYKYLSRAYSASNSFLQVTIANDAKAKPGRRLPLILETTDKRRCINYKVFAKGSLVTQGKWRCWSKKQRVNIMITNDMAPTAKLLVYYIRGKNGEIVADAITFPIKDIFGVNKVSLKFNKSKVLPGEKVELKIRAEPNSLINILSVDKSVILYKTGNDITLRDVMNELSRYDSRYSRFFWGWNFWFPRRVPGVDAFTIFDQTGLYVLTDALLYQYISDCQGSSSSHFRSSMDSGPMFASAQAGPPGPTSTVARGTAPSTLATPARTRKRFPATWIWANTTTGSDGTAVYKTTAPDTITTWVTSAFAVNPTSGLALATELENITTFQTFFMRFDLPYSAIRGEVVIVLISVFNYLPRDQEVYVTMASNSNFSFVDTNGLNINPGPNGLTKKIRVSSNGIEGVYIPIIPTKVGTITFNAQARSTEAADAVEQKFLVEAEGSPQSYNVPFLINLKTARSFSASVSISFPPNFVKDSEFIKIQVIGDLMGPVLNNIQNLLRMSYGCGEQNLAVFVPSVYVSSYLKATNRLTPELAERAQRYLKAGYQRQLTYSRSDGSFSGYGNRDKSGSTWLTAYVIKAFSQATEFTFIDKNVITRAIQWLLKQQQDKGYFNEPGIVFSKSLQGGSASSTRSLTAFVLIALVEAKQNKQIEVKIQKEVDDAISKATSYVAAGAPSSIRNVYELAISFYALILVKHFSATSLLSALEKRANTEDGQKYWQLPDFDIYKISQWRSWRPPRSRARAVDVEATSYVLLGYNLRDDLDNGIRVLKWLGRQRNPWGGFISTQDTVIALQGLTHLGKKLYSTSTSVTITAKGDTWSGKTFNANNANALVLQSEDLPKSVRKIEIIARGRGICLLETAVFFNVFKEMRQPAFELKPTVLRDSTRGFVLKMCFRWLRAGQSTMGYLEITLPSGMEADLGSLNTKQTFGQFKKIEKAFRQINLYFDAILSNEMCIEINVDRVSMIARHKPVPCRLSEYYEPSNEVIVMYQSKALANATIIEVCGAGNCIQLK